MRKWYLVVSICLLGLLCPQSSVFAVCSVTPGSDVTISSACQFAGTVNGVDVGGGVTGLQSKNTGKMTVATGGALTIPPGQTIVAGTIDITGNGTIVVFEGGEISVGSSLVVTDTDGDMYPDEDRARPSKIVKENSNVPPSAIRQSSAASAVDADPNTKCLDTWNVSNNPGGLASCKRCTTGAVVNQSGSEDIFNQCTASSYTRSANKCAKTRTGDVCSGSGSCAIETAYAAAGKIYNAAGTEIDADTTDNTGIADESVVGACTATRKYYECDGAGNPTTSQYATGALSLTGGLVYTDINGTSGTPTLAANCNSVVSGSSACTYATRAYGCTSGLCSVLSYQSFSSNVTNGYVLPCTHYSLQLGDCDAWGDVAVKPTVDDNCSTDTSHEICTTVTHYRGCDGAGSCSATSGTASNSYFTAGTDPYNECSAYACTSLVWGWSGNSCMSAVETALNGDCDGGGACAYFTSACAEGSTLASCGSSQCKNACPEQGALSSYNTTAEVCYTSGQQTCSTGYMCNSNGTCSKACMYKGTSGTETCFSICSNQGWGCTAGYVNSTCTSGSYTCGSVAAAYCLCGEGIIQ